MLIRTQDREMLVNLSSLTMIGYNEYDNSIYGFCKSGRPWTLGVYRSKKRCLEVLDMIQDSHGMCWSNAEDEMIMNDWHVVFEMPEK